MEQFLKRKLDSSDESPQKKAKTEECPHAERCYRRNPHHFREYDHPHLLKLMEEGDDFTLPADYPQEKRVVLEQIEVLKSLQPKPVTQNNKNENNEKASVSLSSLQAKTDSPSAKNENNQQPSTSTVSARNSQRGKTTSFVQNQINMNTTAKSGSMLEKLQKNAPYNLFFTKVKDSIPTLTQTNAISFSDLLCPSLGDLKSSLQINFMIDIAWLMEQYQVHKQHTKPLTILYGDEWPDMEKYIQLKLPNVTPHFVKMKDPFGTHHSKVGLYLYSDDSMRVVISTANLYFEDWNYYNQGLWVSPTLPKMKEGQTNKETVGPTGFKTDFIRYLKHYKLPVLNEWVSAFEKVDCSAVKVFLVTSVPGKHYPTEDGSHVHRVGELLSKHCTLPAKTNPQSEGPLSWGVMAQASSIGSLGKAPADWLRGVLLRSLASHKQGVLPMNSNATLNVVYPSVENVMNSYYGAQGGGCLPYSKATNEKQRWFQEYLHQWKADGLLRSRNMPHIKTYCRVSPCLSKLAYFLITSANLSKSAWGNSIQKDKSTYIRSYEVGVMFLPKFFDEEYFCINSFGDADKKVFPFMYDLPLTPYKSDDYPWCN